MCGHCSQRGPTDISRRSTVSHVYHRHYSLPVLLANDTCHGNAYIEFACMLFSLWSPLFRRGLASLQKDAVSLQCPLLAHVLGQWIRQYPWKKWYNCYCCTSQVQHMLVRNKPITRTWSCVVFRKLNENFKQYSLFRWQNRIDSSNIDTNIKPMTKPWS